MAAKIDEVPPAAAAAAGAGGADRRSRRGASCAAWRGQRGEARRFVVVTGDALSFNTVYRDRNVAWQVQDLPFELVFFCHATPSSVPPASPRRTDPSVGTAATGTEDLLLYRDIVEALVEAAYHGRGHARRRRRAGRATAPGRAGSGRLSFGRRGRTAVRRRTATAAATPASTSSGCGPRSGGGGPDGTRVPPQATIEVFGWQAAEQAGSWRGIARARRRLR